MCSQDIPEPGLQRSHDLGESRSKDFGEPGFWRARILACACRARIKVCRAKIVESQNFCEPGLWRSKFVEPGPWRASSLVRQDFGEPGLWRSTCLEPRLWRVRILEPGPWRARFRVELCAFSAQSLCIIIKSKG